MQRTPAPDRRADGARRIGVHGDVGAPVLRRVHRGAKLRLCVLADVDRIVVRGDAAAGGELELARAEHQLFAGAHQDAIGAVGDRPAADRIAPAQRRARGRRDLVGKAEIAMSAGLRDHRAGRPDARSPDKAAVDRPLQSEGRARHVADAGEAAEQRSFGFGGGDEIDVTHIRRDQDLERDRRHHRVPVRVDQPRHQHPSAAVDDVDILADRRPGGLDRTDPPALDFDPEARAQRVGLAVEQADVGEGETAFARRGLRRGRSAGAGGEHARGRRERTVREFCAETRVEAREGRGMAKAPAERRAAPVSGFA